MGTEWDMVRGRHRAGVVVAVALMCVGAALLAGGAAQGAPLAAHGRATHVVPTPHRQRANVRPILRIDRSSNVALLVLPTPVCPAAQPSCQWMLYMNEPGNPGMPGTQVVGSEGTLTLPLPEYCGPVQIDSLIGPGNWVRKGGLVKAIDNCVPPTTTTTTSSTTTSTTTPTSTTTTSTTTPTSTTTTSTTTPTSTTSTTGPTGSTTTTVPPGVAGNSTTPPTSGTSSALPFTAASGTDPTAMANGSSSLPFTGADIRPMVALGVLLLLLGGLLLMSAESRRRTGRKLVDWFW